MQYKIEAVDLAVVLALVRGGNLANAGDRLSVDASTVFRAIQRIEKGLGQRLFERSRAGYHPSDLALELASHAEQLETQLEAARSLTQASPGLVSGAVRITSTDTIMHGLIAPLLKPLRAKHPLLQLDLHTGNEFASLTRRDADIAIRATRRPPGHLIGKHIGTVQVALFSAKRCGPKSFDSDVAATSPWIAPDDALPDHPSVVWRKRRFPKVSPSYRVASILTVAELIANGAGIGLLPLFMANGRTDLRQITDVLTECQSELWLLTHKDVRHLRRVAAVFGFFSSHLTLEIDSGKLRVR